MAKYIFWRILPMIPILLGITLIVFLLVHVSGDPVLLMLGEEATAEQIEALTKSLGLDRPFNVQYLPIWATSFKATWACPCVM